MTAVATRSLSSNREMREFLEEAQQLGFAAERTSGGHVKLTHPDVSEPIFAPSSPSDWRSVANMRSQILRALRRAEEEKTVEEHGSEESPMGLYDCGICRGRGIKKGFFSAAALNLHVRKQHPAPPIPSTEPKEEPVSEATNVVQIEKKHEPVSYEELADWLDVYLGEEGKTISRQKIINEFAPRDATTAVEVLRQRGSDKRTHLDRLVSKGSGLYTWVHAERQERARLSDQSPKQREKEAARPTKVTPPAEAKGTIFEVVNQFVDGQLLVRDEEGNLFTAALRPL